MIRVLKFISGEVRGMHQAAFIVASFSLGSQLLALVRDRLLAASFGAGHVLDIYYAAFRVPDFLFATVASLFSIYALMPILSRYNDGDGEGAMVSFLRMVLTVFFVGMSLVSFVAFLFAPWLAHFIAPGIAVDPQSQHDLILLMRIILLQPIFLGASNTIASLTQLHHRFVLYSVSPLLYNLGIIFGAIVLYPYIGIAGLGWGVVLGALMHLMIQVPYLVAQPSSLHVSFWDTLPTIKEVLLLSIPRTLALASRQISLLVITAIASLLSAGSIAVFTFAFNLQAVPLTIIGVSYSVAVFPTLARLHAQGARAELTRSIETALRHILFWAIPAMVFVIILRAQIVRTVLGAGVFDWNATRLTAASLALLILALATQSISMLIARSYYAVGNTKKPLYFGCANIVISIGSAVGLLALFREYAFLRAVVESLLRVSDVPGTSILMLALGYALGSIAETLIGYIFFSRDFSISSVRIIRLLGRSFTASIIGGLASYIILSLHVVQAIPSTTLGVFLQGFSAGVIGIGVAVAILYALKNEELLETFSAFSRRFRPVSVPVEPSDIGA